MDPLLYEHFYAIEDRFWWSVATRRLFFRLISGLPIARPRRVLDVGCGTGIMLQEFPPTWDGLSGCDFSQDALRYCHARGLSALVRCDATVMPFAGDEFDLVLALDVVEHVDDDSVCLAEMVRVCRPGGYLLVHVPAFQILWSDKDVLNHHRRRYRRGEVRRLVEGLGLEVQELFYINILLFPVALARALSCRLLGRSVDADSARRTVDRLYHVPARVNDVMTAFLDAECAVARRLPLPFGMSLVCLARKPLPEAASR